MLSAPDAIRLAVATMFAVATSGCSRETFSAAQDASPDARGDAAAAPIDAAADSASAKDAPYSGPGLKCGEATCRPGAEVCCLPDIAPDSFSHVSWVFSALSGSTARCTAPALCGSPSVAVQCNTPSFCADKVAPGTVCCLRHDASVNSFTRFECVQHADCDESKTNDVLCDPNKSTPTCTDPRTRCSEFEDGVHFDAFGICVP